MRHARTRLGHATILLTVVLLSLCLQAVVASAQPATSTVAPHVATSQDTDVCAMCHRAHTAASTVDWSAPDQRETRHSALLVGTTSEDSELCFSCHGVESLGSGTDIQSSIEASSGHRIDETSAPYGPVPTACGTCHDTHGAARIASGIPYPALVRSTDASGTLFYSGDRVCTACHLARPANRFPGLAVWTQSPHSRIPTATGGTGIVCSACHDPHGSSIAPAIVSRIETPAASSPATVTANDRTLCNGCHGSPIGLWPGSAAYVGSSHASSTATVTVTGEWVKSPTTRTVGECQNCHAPMGRSDASGTVLPDLLDAAGRSLCDRCHRAAGPSASDIATLAYSPTTPGLEIISAYAPVTSQAYGRLHVYSRESTVAGVPIGPREVFPVSSVGALAVGDVDGDGLKEALVSDLASARVALVEYDPLRVAKTTLLSLPNGRVAKYLAIGDVVIDGTGLPEVVAVSATGTVEVSRLSSGSLQSVATTQVAATPSALSSGDVTGTADAEVVLATNVPDGLLVMSVSSGSITTYGPYATRANPVGLSVADIDAEGLKNEIAVVSAGGGPDDAVTLVQGDGTQYAYDPIAQGSPTAVLAADILPGYTAAGTSGAEIAVAYGSAIAQSGVRVTEQPVNGGLGLSSSYSTGLKSNASALAFGDADGDGDQDLAVGIAGSFTKQTDAVSPGIQVFSPDAAGLGLVSAFSKLEAGGSELATNRAAIALADLGAVGPSRHPVGAAPSSHVSTETTPAARHVECADCHNTHRARNDSADTTALPGELIGAWGVRPENVNATTVSLTGRQTVVADYEVCFGCHSSWDPSASRWISSEVNTRAASFHPIEGPARETSATGSTLTTATAVGATIRCTSCHGSSASGPQGPHRSPTPPLLVKRFPGSTVSNPDMLCYTCHNSDVYLSGASDGVSGTRSGFYDTAAGPPDKKKMHSYHTSRGVACAACHRSHGANAVKHLLRGDLANGDPFSYTWSSTGGQCTVGCHNQPSTAYAYTR